MLLERHEVQAQGMESFLSFHYHFQERSEVAFMAE